MCIVYEDEEVCVYSEPPPSIANILCVLLLLLFQRVEALQVCLAFKYMLCAHCDNIVRLTSKKNEEVTPHIQRK